MHKKLFVASLCVAAIALARADAALYMYDGFPTSGTGAYNTGDLGNQDADHGSMVGFSSAQRWTSGTSTINITSAGLDHPLLITELGGAISFNHNVSYDGNVRCLHRAFDRGTDTAPAYYASTLMSVDDDFSSATNSTAYIQISNDLGATGAGSPPNLDNRAGIRWGFVGDGSELDAFIDYRDASGSTQRAILANGVSRDDPHLFIAKMESGAGAGDTADTLTVWFDPPAVGHEYEAGTPVLDAITSGNVRDNEGIFIDDLGAAWTYRTHPSAAYADEVRFGTTWGEVVYIPEPATLLIWSLLAGLAVGLGWRRK